MKPATTLIVSTYNWPQALDVCLQSIACQSIMPDEIIVADDGSGTSTRHVIGKYINSLNVPVKHVWQEDKGFRLAEIRNRAILQSKSEYIIFIDGDIILNNQFVADHILFRKKAHFITGSRVLTDKNLTNRIISGLPFSFNILDSNLKNRLNGIRSKLLAYLFTKTDNQFLNVRGCNMSFWKSDLLDVDGFNMEFTGWGREDSDLVVRLLNAGKRKIKLKFAGIQYHLDHTERDKGMVDRNNKILEKSVAGKTTFASSGISSLKNIL